MKIQSDYVGKYIVLSIGNTGSWSVASMPVPHNSKDSAQKECDRLAQLYPGKAFVHLYVSGGSIVQEVLRF